MGDQYCEHIENGLVCMLSDRADVHRVNGEPSWFAPTPTRRRWKTILLGRELNTVSDVAEAYGKVFKTENLHSITITRISDGWEVVGESDR